MAELFWAYWDASIRFALLALLLLLASPLLRRFLSPRLLCWAWAALLLRLALPFSLPYASSVFNWHESIQPSSWTEAIRQGVVNSGLGETILPRLRDEDHIVLATKIGLSWETALLAVWLAGALGMAAYLGLHVIRLRRFFRGSELVRSGPLYERFKDTRRRYGIHANVPLLMSEDVRSPGIAGIFNPRVVLPRRCVERLSREELRCVFLHELTHFRRGDLFLHHLLLLICYMHWYNPLAWLALRQFKKSMEQACDREVLDSVCVRAARDYGYTLLRVFEQSALAGRSAAGTLCLLGSRRSGELKERIQRIAKPQRNHPFLGSLGLCLFGASFVIVMTGEQDQPLEAERLVRLTKLSNPLLAESLRSGPQRTLLTIEGRNASIDQASGDFESAQNWIKSLDVSNFIGQNIEVLTRFSLTGGEAASS